jgi:hypothetical protein
MEEQRAIEFIKNNWPRYLAFVRCPGAGGFFACIEGIDGLQKHRPKGKDPSPEFVIKLLKEILKFKIEFVPIKEILPMLHQKKQNLLENLKENVNMEDFLKELGVFIFENECLETLHSFNDYNDKTIPNCYMVRI